MKRNFRLTIAENALLRLRALRYTFLVALLPLCCPLLCGSQSAAKRTTPADWVNVFTGTSNSRWMQFPGATVPFGLVKFSPDNQGNVWDGGYEYTIASISGFSFLHSMALSSMSVMPMVGSLEMEPGQSRLFPGSADGPFGQMWTAGYRSRIRKDTETGKPGYYAVDLVDAKTRVEVTSTMRTGWMRVQFPSSDQAHLLYDFAPAAEEKSEIHQVHVQRVGDREIRGSLTQRNGYAGDFTVYFVSQFSQPFMQMDSWQAGEYAGGETNYGTDWRIPRTLSSNVLQLESKKASGILLNFKTTAGEKIVVRTGISLVGEEEARRNLETESAPYHWDFDAVATGARKEWNALLERVDVEGGSDDDRTKFYTNLYRAYSAKAVLEDAEGTYRDACGAVRKIEAPADHMYSSDALWGAQWTLGPLWTLVTPERVNSYSNFMLLEAKRDGWLPYAPVNLRYAPIMAAQHQVAVLVGAWKKGATSFDPQAAYVAVKKVLTTPGEPFTCGGTYPGGFAGDRHLAAYLASGYVPEEAGPASSTFEYAYDDACAATFADGLGHTEDAIYFARRSKNWRKNFDPESHYARRRLADGTWVTPFNLHQFGTGGSWNRPGFVEGTPWIYTWFVPHDIPGLIAAMGRDTFNSRLEEGFAKSYVDLTNEPNLQAPWLFNLSGKPSLAQKHARDVFSHVFDTSPLNGWPGEEDEGQMGAYVVLAGMGLFDLEGGCDREPGYQISGPAFRRVVLHLKDATFEIAAHNDSDTNVYIHSATLNGHRLSELRLKHADLIRGGKLVLEMSSHPED